MDEEPGGERGGREHDDGAAADGLGGVTSPERHAARRDAEG